MESEIKCRHIIVILESLISAFDFALCAKQYSSKDKHLWHKRSRHRLIILPLYYFQSHVFPRPLVNGRLLGKLC